MNRKQFALVLICTMVFAFIGGVVSVAVLQGTPVEAQNKMNFTAKAFKLPDGIFIGIAKNGKLHLIVPKVEINIPVRLTGIQMQEARSAQSAEVDLTPYEGKAVMVSGYDGGSWIYQAEVLDSGGPLLTAVVQKVFSK